MIIYLLYFIINYYYIDSKMTSLRSHLYCDVIPLMSLNLFLIVLIFLKLYVHVLKKSK